MESDLEDLHLSMTRFYHECVEGICGGQFKRTDSAKVTFNEQVMVSVLSVCHVQTQYAQPYATLEVEELQTCVSSSSFASTESWGQTNSSCSCACSQEGDSPRGEMELPNTRYVLLQDGCRAKEAGGLGFAHAQRCGKFLDKWLVLLASTPLLPADRVSFDPSWKVCEQRSFLIEYISEAGESGVVAG